MSDTSSSQGKVGTIWVHIDELAVRVRWVFYSLIAATVFFMAFPVNPSFLQNPFAMYDPVIALVLQQVVKDVLPKRGDADLAEHVAVLAGQAHQ